MKKALYLECQSGISGDMTVAALLDLGADPKVLEEVLQSLPLSGYKVKISRVQKSAIDCCDFDVQLDSEHENHDHDMGYLFGHEHGHVEEHFHGREHGHEEEHLHGHVEEHLHGREHGHDEGHMHGKNEYERGHGDAEECFHEHNHDHGKTHGHLHAHEELHGNVEGHEHVRQHLHEHEHGEEYLHEHGHAEEYLHEHGHGHAEEHLHEHGHAEEHLHEHGYAEKHLHEHTHEHAHSHVHRGMKEITEIINAGKMTDNARRLALHIFEILAEAEAKAHGKPVSEVHFHEVGAVDSIVDIVSAAVCFDNLGVSEVIVPPMTEGHGTIRCQHGILPIPVPAVANIAAAHKLSLKLSSIHGELITPTGAAFVAAVKTAEEMPENASLLGVGLGAGKREYSCPGFLRAMLLEVRENKKEDTIIKLETNIDDCSGEVLGYTMELLFEAGARDVYYQPIFMKKNRPAWLLSVICMEEDREALEEIIFRETTTIGIRRSEMNRAILARRLEKVSTPCGEVQVKICSTGAEEYCYPEYESVRKLAREQKKPFAEIYRAAVDSRLE